MRFISPSFNSQGWTKSFDLNSIAHGTSPAFTLHAEHPTGEQYASYLTALAEEAELQIRTRTEVTEVRPLGGDRGFEVRATAGRRPGDVLARSALRACARLRAAACTALLTLMAPPPRACPPTAF